MGYDGRLRPDSPGAGGRDPDRGGVFFVDLCLGDSAGFHVGSVDAPAGGDICGFHLEVLSQRFAGRVRKILSP